MTTQTISTGLSQNAMNKASSAQDEAALIALANELTISELDRLVKTDSQLELETLASNPFLNEIQQRYLATTGNLAVQCRLAANPSLIDTLQKKLAESDIPEVLEALAGNRKLTPASQLVLIQNKMGHWDQRVYILIELARNPALTEYMQQYMTNYVDLRIMVSLATNPSIPESMMELLLKCNEDEISAGLASNTALPESLQAKLFACGNVHVIENLTKNPSAKLPQQK